MQPPTATVSDVVRDLEAEHDALDAVVVALTPAQWEEPTPSPRWRVRDQIGHLAYFDRTAALAITDPEGFAVHRSELMEAAAAAFEPGADPDAADDATLGEFRAMSAPDLLDAWRSAQRELIEAAQGLDDDDRIEWYGPSMGAKSFLTARLMETWAHGTDVADAVGAHLPATDRLVHIAQLGVITRAWSYRVRGEAVPDTPVAVVLRSPEERVWTWGDDDAVDRIEGPLEDFCLVVTQRRHVDDTDLVVTGEAAADWMAKAQAFAGAASAGPDPKS